MLIFKSKFQFLFFFFLVNSYFFAKSKEIFNFFILTKNYYLLSHKIKSFFSINRLLILDFSVMIFSYFKNLDFL